MSEEVKNDEKFENEIDKMEEEKNIEESSDEKMNEKIKKLQDELEDWKGAYTRKMAEFQNYAKRKDKELLEARKFASEKIVEKILSPVDNLERCVDASKTTEDFTSLVKGVEMILSQIHDILNSEGVEKIDAHGKEFNPYEHQAMLTEVSEEHEENTIIMELQKGYKMKGKVIRPSLVKVAKNKK